MESYLIVDDDTGVVLKIEKGSVLSSYGLPLSDDHRWHYLLTKLGLALLDGSEHHVATGCGRKSVQPTTDTTDSDDVKILGAWKNQTKGQRRRSAIMTWVQTREKNIDLHKDLKLALHN